MGEDGAGQSNRNRDDKLQCPPDEPQTDIVTIERVRILERPIGQVAIVGTLLTIVELREEEQKKRDDSVGPIVESERQEPRRTGRRG